MGNFITSVTMCFSFLFRNWRPTVTKQGFKKLRDLMSSQLDNAVELIKESLPKRLDDISIDTISNTLENFKLNGVD